MIDLIVRNARLCDRATDRLFDIGVGKGRIVAIERRLGGRGARSTTPRAGSPVPA